MHHHIPAQRAASAAAHLKANAYRPETTRSLRIVLPAQKTRPTPPPPPDGLRSHGPGAGPAGPDTPPSDPAAGAAAPGHGRHRGPRRRLFGWW